MPIPKKNQLVGLDIGSSAIKLVEIEDGKKGRILKNFGIIGLPHNAIVEGSIKEMELISSAIISLFRHLKIKNKNVATSVSGYSVIVKKIPVNKKKGVSLESTIYEEAEQYIPYDIHDVNLDYEVLGGKEGEAEGEEEAKEPEASEKQEETGPVDVMLVAAKKDIVEEYLRLLNLAKLNPVVLEVDVFAIQNAFEAAIQDTSECCAIINVGAEELEINAIKAGVSIFTRDSSYGGAQITEAIMKKLDIPYEEAEKIKLGGEDITKVKKELEDIFTSVVSTWIQEIKRALDFVATTYPDENIEKLYVCGGACRVPGFQKYLEMETDIPVLELNPFASLTMDEKIFDPKYLSYMAPQAAVAVGLALRSMGDK